MGLAAYNRRREEEARKRLAEKQKIEFEKKLKSATETSEKKSATETKSIETSKTVNRTAKR